MIAGAIGAELAFFKISSLHHHRYAHVEIAPQVQPRHHNNDVIS